MVFNSLVFLIFIALFFPLYFATKGRLRTWVCLLASYIFYGWWDWRFLSLILFSTLMDWWFGLWLGFRDAPAEARARWEKGSAVLQLFGRAAAAADRLGANRKTILIGSMVMNLGFLGVFKYFNFFADTFAGLLHVFGLTPSWTTLHIILPVGISFYTFQSMSYTIDVYRREIGWEPSLLKFATFIALFPQLVAGPIVRVADFLHQMESDKRFNINLFYSGLGRILWGFFKKVAIADSLAPFVDQVFATPAAFGSLHLLTGVIFYSFQIYCDFSGYSDIAIGLARIMGYHFPENFRTPYFSASFSEFWTRWHISLSSWLRDYLYIPLGGNRHGRWHTYRNNLLTMLLGGLWHGANWAFVFWGLLHGSYLIAQRLAGPVWRRCVRLLHLPRLIDTAVSVATVYILTLFAWVYFRSGSIGLAGGDSFATAHAVIGGIFSFQGFHTGAIVNKFQAAEGVFLIAVLLSVEVSNIRYRWNDVQLRQPFFRLLAFAALLWLIALFGTFGANAFIYFQF
jgi:D-alanyl-lipoteichoic acid acyltransferase DltB (MBOAT superfamily)